MSPLFSPALALAGLLVLPLASCSSPMASSKKSSSAPATVAHVDLPRYMGEWYVIANVPYFLEKGKVASSDIYRMRPDGKMDNIYQFRKGTLDAPEKQWKGVAWVVDTESNAEWKIQFIWPLTTTYLIVDLDPAYQWSVVTIPNKKLVWILSRNRHMPASTYQDIIARLKAKGFDTSKIEKVPQPDSQG